MQKTKYLFYSLSRNSQNPLDDRFIISSLTNIDTELILQYRYEGLIFFVVDENKHYLFLNDLTTPIALQSFISSSNVFGITSSTYNTLLTDLNNTSPTLGSIITVFPLGVSFIFDGSNWKYYNGTYNVTNDTQLNTIPSQLRSEGKLIIMGGTTRYIYTSDLVKSTEVIVDTVIPVSPERNRYYLINDILHYSIGDVVYRIGEKIKIISNQSLVVLNENNINDNVNIINHNLNSVYISVYFRININNTINTISKMISVDYQIIDNNNIKILSEFIISGDLIVIAK